MVSKTADSTPTITAKNLSIGYIAEQPVLENINFTYTGNQIIRISDANGTGKSTFIETCSGYLPILHGTLLINGLEPSNRALCYSRKIVRSNIALHDNLSVKDHLLLCSDLNNIDRNVTFNRAYNMKLDTWFRTRITELSTGTKKKLWYIFCTTGHFNILFLDEPFNGVDSESIQIMAQEISQWKEEAMIVLISHVMPTTIHIDTTLHLTSE